MTKIQDSTVPTDGAADANVRTERKSLLVGLSNCPNLTAIPNVVVETYLNGEGKQRVVPAESLNITSIPPKRSGELICKGLTDKAKGKIKLGSRMLQYMAETQKKAKAFCSFITLTYGKNYPNDKIAKTHLDNFLKRMRRMHNTFHYVWVAERQKRGAIHFHILTPSYTDKEFINASWTQISDRWLESEKLPPQQLYPNVIATYHAGRYMAKYMSKEDEHIKGNMYGISQNTRLLMKPCRVSTYTFSPEYVNELIEDSLTAINPKTTCFSSLDFRQNVFCWLTDISELTLKLSELEKLNSVDELIPK